MVNLQRHKRINYQNSIKPDQFLFKEKKKSHFYYALHSLSSVVRSFKHHINNYPKQCKQRNSALKVYYRLPALDLEAAVLVKL